MINSENKKTGYISQVVQEINRLVDQAGGRDELKKKLGNYVAEKIIESYKNGIRAGKKQEEGK